MQKTALDGTALDAWFDAAKVKPLSKAALGEVNADKSFLTGLVSSPLSGIAHFFGAVPIAVRRLRSARSSTSRRC